MARPDKASNGTGAASTAVLAVLSYWTIAIQVNRLRSKQIVEMAMNASGIRDTARVLHVSTNTVMTELKKLGWQTELK